MIKFNLRLPADLKVLLEAAATRNQRSLNAEIVYRLRAGIEGYQQDYVSQRVRP